MLKHKHYGSASAPSSQLQQQSTSASSLSGHQETLFKVSDLINTGRQTQSLSLKLTDECSAAVKHAIKCKKSIRMHVKKEETLIEVDLGQGNLMVFKCALHVQTDTDSICYDPKQASYKNVGVAMRSRLQVQATDKSFADMKEKTQKLVEAEQQRKAKDMPKSQKTHKIAQQFGQSQKMHKIVQLGQSQNHRKTHTSTHSNILAKITSKRTHSPSPSFFPRKIPHHSPPTKQLTPPTHHTQSDTTPKTISPPFLEGPASVESTLQGPASVESTLQHSSSCSPEDFMDQGTGALTMVTKPARDWSQEFGKINDQEQAKRYHNIFKIEYPEYRKYYEELMKVSLDFRELKHHLENAKSEEEYQRMEKVIRTKFAELQNDQEFLFKRQTHHDLRAKLEVIKNSLEQWNNSDM